MYKTETKLICNHCLKEITDKQPVIIVMSGDYKFTTNDATCTCERIRNSAEAHYHGNSCYYEHIESIR